MLAFSVIKIEQHRALYGSAGENSALLRELAASPPKSSAKPRRSSEITTGSTIAHMAAASLRRGAACCARSSLPQSPATERPAPKGLLASNFRSRFSTNRAKLNRQIQEVEHLVTYRKQTTAPHSNSQNFHFCSSTFLPSFRAGAASLLTPRIPRA